MNIDIALIRNDSDEQVSPISEGFAATRVNSHLARDLLKWFYDTSTGAATGAARCGSFIGGAQIARGVGYPGIRWTRRFTWFGPPERNTLRPRVNGVVLLCFSARLRSSLFSLSACVCFSSTVTVICPALL
jgi:hypothetical protein